VQRRFIRFVLRGLGWTDIHDLPPYEDRCALLHLDTLTRRSIACVMFVFDVQSGRVNSLDLLSVLDLIAPRYPTHGTEFLRIEFHPTNYGSHDSMLSAMRQFNEVIGLFCFGQSDPGSVFESSRADFVDLSNSSPIHRPTHPRKHFVLPCCFSTVNIVDVSIRRINSFS
jgi:hypothetical protein